MPYTKSWLDLEAQLGGRFVLKGTPEQIRQQAQSSASYRSSLLPPPSDAVSINDGEIEGIRYRSYVPQARQSESIGLPVGVFAHGGGLMIGDLETDDGLCRKVTEKVPCILISVEYRLSPEHKVPAHLEDMVTVTNWVYRNAASLGGDAERIFTAGISAGGSLALEIANYFSEEPSSQNIVKGIVSVVPFTLHPAFVPKDYRSIYKSFKENEKDVPFIDRETMENFYFHANALPEDRRIFVALATENHAKFPPTYLVSCEADPLRDDAYVMELLLKKAGVPVKHQHYKQLPHCFWVFPTLPETKTFENDLVDGVKWLISEMAPERSSKQNLVSNN